MRNVKKPKQIEFSETQLREDLRREARVLGMHQGAADLIAGEVAIKLEKWLGDKPTITQSDLDRRVVMEVKKYNKDLAFILGERNKLI